MDAAFATKIGITALGALAMCVVVMNIGKDRKPIAPHDALGVLITWAAMLFAVWRWL